MVKILIDISLMLIISTPELIRHLCQLKTVAFPHRCLIFSVFYLKIVDLTQNVCYEKIFLSFFLLVGLNPLTRDNEASPLPICRGGFVEHLSPT